MPRRSTAIVKAAAPKKKPPRKRSETEVALYQRSEPARRDQTEFMAAWDKLPWMRAVAEKIAYAKASVRWTAVAVKAPKEGNGNGTNGTKLYTKTGIGQIRTRSCGARPWRKRRSRSSTTIRWSNCSRTRTPS